MSVGSNLKLLFVINPVAGPNPASWKDIISNYFTEKPFIAEYFILEKKSDIDKIRKKINDFLPDRVVAVGGDGTVTMVAKLVAVTNSTLGILPAGSANGKGFYDR